MEIVPTYTTGKVIVAKGRTWRGVMITETVDGYTVQDDNGRGRLFRTLRDAMDYIEAMFSKEA